MATRKQPAPAPSEASDGGLRAERDRAAIGRLADELLPAVMARLAASSLGEVEIREGSWKVRLRKPAVVHQPARLPLEGAAAAAHAAAAAPSPGWISRGRVEEREHDAEDMEPPELSVDYIVATSPAVGVYNPRRGLSAGMRIGAGERLGSVDVLGVPYDVIAPVDGLVGSSLAEAGEAVEYGQELVRIEPPVPVGAEVRLLPTDEPPRGAEL